MVTTFQDMEKLPKEGIIEGIIEKVSQGPKLDLIIFDGENRYNIRTLTRVDSNLGLIPYEMGLLNQQVSLNLTHDEYQGSSHYAQVKHYRVHELDILSGPLEGSSYNWSMDYYE